MPSTELTQAQGGSARPVGWPTEVISYDDGGTIKYITADLVGDVDSTYEATMTESPIEFGASINDHRVRKAPVLNLELMQSNAPINDPAWTLQDLSIKPRAVQTQVHSLSLLAGRAVTAGLTALGVANEPVQIQTLQGPKSQARQLDLYDQLKALWYSGALCSVNHGGNIYPNMVLNSLKKSTSKAQPGLWTYQCGFGQPATVSVKGEALPKPQVLRAKPKADAGGRSAEEIAEGPEKTALKALKDKAFGR